MKATHPRFIHRLINWRYGITPKTVLNDGPPPDGASLRVDADLKAAMNRIKATAFQTSGSAVRVDYARLKESDIYEAYCLCSRRLQTFDPAELSSHEERLTFWINVYNALLIDAVIAYEVQHSVNDVPGFFWRAAYSINGFRFSTMDIEHGILRANAGHPAIPGPHFSRRDSRQAYSLETLDPRLHFALVCASRSCPPIAIYDESRINEQLDLAARTFINGGGVEIDRERRMVRLSRIFLWYASDFGGALIGDKHPILDYVAPYISDEETRAWLAENRNRARIRFQRYDWSLNTASIT